MMTIELYPLTLMISTLLLVLWSYFSKKEFLNGLWRSLFFISIGAYFFSLLFTSGTIDQKMSHLFRDLMLMSGVGLLFQVFIRSQAAFLTGFLFLIGGLAWLTQTDWFTFPDPKEDGIVLDQDAELLVELGENQLADQLLILLGNYEVRIDRAFYPEDPAATELDDYYLVDIANNEPATIEEVKAILSNSDVVDWVEGNEKIEVAPLPAATPTKKPRVAYNDPGVDNLWGFGVMQAEQLISYLRKEKHKPKKQALIAILDTGIDAKHEDLQDNYSSIRSKYDDDPRMHGTHCAGIAAAVSNNEIGVASFSPSSGYVKVTSIKVLNSFGMGTQQSIISGIIEAADKKADVISLSLGGRSNQSKQTAYKKAVDYARKKGAIVVAAAGNSRMDSKDYAPVNTPGIIGVSAIDERLNKAEFSNFVNNIEMALAAPGVNIYSTVPGDSYASFNGTSMATPYVSGLIGLMKSFAPGLTSEEAFKLLESTGKSTSTPESTGMLIQPYNAVKALLARDGGRR